MRIVDNDIGITEDCFNVGNASVRKGLEYAKRMPNKDFDSLNFYLYWIGDNVSYKHSVVIKSFLATQNLNKCKLYIYSDVDLSNNQYIKPFLNNTTVFSRFFDVVEESKGTVLENHRYVEMIKHHHLNPALESDLFRILMLHKYGGVYIDFDVLLLRDFSPLIDREFMYQWENYPTYNWINGAIMYVKKNSKLSNDLMKEMLNMPPVHGTLCWASDIYCKIKEYNNEWIVYPGSFFNTEWQYGTVINPFGLYQLSNEMFDGAFSWHWHNKWTQTIQQGSKFNQLDIKFTNILNSKRT